MGVRVWINRILGALTPDNKPLYRMTPYIVSGEQLYNLEIANPILQKPTLHSAGNMNNLMDFDNLDSFVDCIETTTFPTGKAISEYRERSNNNLVARREFDFATMTQSTLLYNADGSVAQSRVVRTTFPTGQIKNEVTIT